MTEKPIIPPRDNAPAAESRKKPSRAPADDTLPAPQTNPSDMQVDSGATNSLSTAPMQKIKPSPVPGTRKPHKDAPPNVKANPSSTRTGGKTAAWLGGSGAVAWEIQIETEGSLEKGKTNSDLTNKRKCDASAGGTKPDGVPPKEAATEEDNPIDHVAKAAVGARPSDGGRKRRWSASLEPVAEDELEEGEFRPDVENAEGATCPLAVAAGDPMLNTVGFLAVTQCEGLSQGQGSYLT